MVSIHQVQQKSCSSLQQRNQKIGNKVGNISQKTMTAPSFTGDHLSAKSSMGRAQVVMNSKIPFKGKGALINEGVAIAKKEAESRLTEQKREGIRLWRGPIPTTSSEAEKREHQITSSQKGNAAFWQHESDHFARRQHCDDLREREDDNARRVQAQGFSTFRLS